MLGHVAARARVAVPVPGTADAVARLDHVRGEPELPQVVERVEPGDTRAHDHHVELLGDRHLVAVGRHPLGSPCCGRRKRMAADGGSRQRDAGRQSRRRRD